jgi:hypothetical protein
MTREVVVDLLSHLEMILDEKGKKPEVLDD